VAKRKNSNEYILDQCLKTIRETMKHMNCRHRWGKFGYGYQCDKCRWYTGLNSQLNKLIEKEFGPDFENFNLRSDL
jgi:hypothetical protein